eukprot:6534771-Prymnesium_polylepis.1
MADRTAWHPARVRGRQTPTTRCEGAPVRAGGCTATGAWPAESGRPARLPDRSANSRTKR